jgi:voltage-gated potassium channel
MKTLGTQLALLLEDTQMRRNLGALFKYFAFLLAVVVLFTVVFQFLMLRVEGQQHSWVSGIYWTLVTMTTLGFGDITFETDPGRAFSIVVILSGLVLLLVTLPFVLIRYFFAPWLEAQLRLRAPRSLPRGVQGHVIICADDPITPGLVEGLRLHDIPYVLLEPDAGNAARRHGEGQQVLWGEVDARETYVAARVREARMVVANLDDQGNTNVILTVREIAPEVPIVAVASSEDAVDLMELAGATHVLPLRKQLGEQLANRINAGHAEAHVLGHFRDLVIAEFPVLNTPFSGQTIRETRLRETLGLNIVAVWEQAALEPAHPDRELTDHCVPVVIGTEEQVRELDEMLYIYDTNWHPVIVIGGGKVGRAATRTLKRKGVPVHLIERKPELAARWKDLPDRMLVGDAANRELLEDAGLLEAPSVLLTTNDDAMNVYLAVYCRKLNPRLRIVSRITHDRNIDSIRRAGADLVLSYAGLGVAALVSMARGRRMISLGEGIELFEEVLPRSLAGATLAESGIRVRTGLNVVAIEREGAFEPAPRASEVLSPESKLFMIGTLEQHEAFRAHYSEAGREHAREAPARFPARAG